MWPSEGFEDDNDNDNDNWIPLDLTTITTPFAADSRVLVSAPHTTPPRKVALSETVKYVSTTMMSHQQQQQQQQQQQRQRQQSAGESQYQESSPQQEQEQEQHQHQHQQQLFQATVVSPPPAAPPPPPPPPSDSSVSSSVRSPADSRWREDEDSLVTAAMSSTAPLSTKSRYNPTNPFDDHSHNSYGSYESTTHINISATTATAATAATTTRPAEVPMITNYSVSPAQSFYRPRGVAEPVPVVRQMGSRGDISVRPNTGQTNDEFGGLGSLREVTSRLRWMTIVCTLTCLVWEGFAFPARLLINSWDHPAKVVLGGYLAFFGLLVLGVELNAPMRDNFGVLYHPLGRSFLLVLMSSMCYGIHIAWWETLLCAAFGSCSVGYVYAFAKYPEYRRWQDYNDNRIWQDVGSAAASAKESAADWADPHAPSIRGNVSSRSTSMSWRDTQRETQALLHQV